jgi:hypothetical protein
VSAALALIGIFGQRLSDSTARGARSSTRAELGAEARLAQIGSLDDVRYAVLESNGKVSFLSAA